LQFDISIVGAGIIGLTIAEKLSQNGISCVLIDPHPPKTDFDCGLIHTSTQRVVAVTRASENLLRQTGAWQNIEPFAISSYTGMQVWSHHNQAEFEVSAQEVSQPNIGHIICNEAIRAAIAKSIQQPKNNQPKILQIMANRVTEITSTQSETTLTLDNAQKITSALCIATDGSNSAVKKLLAVNEDTKSYRQKAIVTTVTTEKPHQKIARQQFGLHGTIAFLPMADSHNSSIVWSLDNDYAEQILALEQQEFKQALAAVIDGRLGQIESCTPIMSFPLTARQNQSYYHQSVVFAGDAAHTIHPLAGQGVNLGLLDADLICQLLIKNKLTNQALNQTSLLAKYQRRRRTDATNMLLAMQGFKSVYQINQPVVNTLRGFGIKVLNQSKTLKKQIVEKALGLT
jgi:2-polyprenylphenol 6-hydroxylase